MFLLKESGEKKLPSATSILYLLTPGTGANEKPMIL